MFIVGSAIVIVLAEFMAVFGYVLVRRTLGAARVQYVTAVYDRLIELYESVEGRMPRQVDRAISECGANARYRPWAYALFCEEHRFHEVTECKDFDYFVTRAYMLNLRRRIVPGEWYGGTVGFDPLAMSTLNSGKQWHYLSSRRHGLDTVGSLRLTTGPRIYAGGPRSSLQKR